MLTPWKLWPTWRVCSKVLYTMLAINPSELYSFSLWLMYGIRAMRVRSEESAKERCWTVKEDLEKVLGLQGRSHSPIPAKISPKISWRSMLKLQSSVASAALLARADYHADSTCWEGLGQSRRRLLESWDGWDTLTNPLDASLWTLKDDWQSAWACAIYRSQSEHTPTIDWTEPECQTPYLWYSSVQLSHITFIVLQTK